MVHCGKWHYTDLQHPSFDTKPTPERNALISAVIPGDWGKHQQTKTTSEQIRHTVRALTWQTAPRDSSTSWDDCVELCLTLLWFSLCSSQRSSAGGQGGPGREAVDRRSLSSVMISSMRSVSNNESIMSEAANQNTNVKERAWVKLLQKEVSWLISKLEMQPSVVKPTHTVFRGDQSWNVPCTLIHPWYYATLCL